MAASISESASPGLLDFAYDGDHTPSGVLDEHMPSQIVRAILAAEPPVRGSFVSHAQRMDCRYSCAAWRGALLQDGVQVSGEGGVGIDEEQYTSDWQTVPVEARSGYREADGEVHRHFWLTLGPDRLLFDPPISSKRRAACRSTGISSAADL